MEEELRDRYLKQLKARLRLSRTHKRDALQDIMGTVDDYLEQTQNPIWEKMVDEIGSPETVAETLNAEYPADAIHQRSLFGIIGIAIVVSLIAYYFYCTNAYMVYEEPAIEMTGESPEENFETWTHFDE